MSLVIKQVVALATAAFVGVLTLGALPAAASTHKTTTTTHPKKKAHKTPNHAAKGITKSAAGKQYLADIAPVNAALTTFAANAKSVTSPSQLPALVAPVDAAFQTFESQILRQTWPNEVRADIKTLVVSLGAVEGDLNALKSANDLTISGLISNLSRDASTTTADSNIVRSDLGLPPPPPSS